MVSQKTDIPVVDLVHFEPGLQNIREKLRWASGRGTTRIEDEAYCLLGLFDVTMPIAYGEGSNAFHRLQETIMQRTNDRSLFLWALDDLDGASSKSSMLAGSGICFNGPYDIIATDISSTSTSPHFTMTNTGLHIALSLYSDEFTQEWIAGTYLHFRTCHFFDVLIYESLVFYGFRAGNREQRRRQLQARCTCVYQT